MQNSIINLKFLNFHVFAWMNVYQQTLLTRMVRWRSRELIKNPHRITGPQISSAIPDHSEWFSPIDNFLISYAHASTSYEALLQLTKLGFQADTPSAKSDSVIGVTLRDFISTTESHGSLSRARFTGIFPCIVISKNEGGGWQEAYNSR